MRPLFVVLLVAVAKLGAPAPVISAPFEDLADGCIRHASSGFLFPKHVGVFDRVGVQLYGQSEADISVNYKAGVVVSGDVFIYPAPTEAQRFERAVVNQRPGEVLVYPTQPEADALAAEYASIKAAIQQVHKPSKLLSEAKIPVLQGNAKHEGYRAYFSFKDDFLGKSQQVNSQVFVFLDGPVWVQYRFTYPQTLSRAAVKDIETFVRDWSWRPKQD